VNIKTRLLKEEDFKEQYVLPHLLQYICNTSSHLLHIGIDVLVEADVDVKGHHIVPPHFNQHWAPFTFI